MWDGFGTPSEVAYGFDIAPVDNLEQPAPTVAEGISGFGYWLRGLTEDVRRGVAYTERSVVQGARSAPTSATDSRLNTLQRAWLYASDMEKVMLVLAVAGVAFIVYDHVKVGK